MNIYLIIILATIIINFLLDKYSDYLNIKNLSPELPEKFKDVFDKDKYKKSQEYTKVRTKFGFISSIYSLLILLSFWFSGGFELLDQYLIPLIDNTLFRGVCYIFILILGQSILSIPFSLYSTFVIEERFGFNKTTWKTYLGDTIKSLLLGILIGAPVLYLVLFLLSEFSDYAWLYAWGATTLISLLMTYIAPIWIMPLFNKFTPLEDGDLKDMIFDYAQKVDYPLTNLYVMDGSKRSSKSNAFFTGFGKNKKIALFDTLIEKHTNEELLAILAHEIGHYKHKHITKSMILSIVHMGVIFFLLTLFLHNQELYSAFYMTNTSIYAGLIFFGMLYSPVESILSIFESISSRKNEYQADKYAKDTTGSSEHMISALKKLSEHNLSNLTPHPFYVFLNYSHPPVLKRIEALEAK